MEQAKEDEKTEKAAKTLKKSLEKQAKQLAVEERKLQRTIAAANNAKAKASKAAATQRLKEGKWANQQLEETLQASVKKPKRLPNAVVAGPSTSRSNSVVLQLEEPEEPVERQRRTKRLPKRYKD